MNRFVWLTTCFLQMVALPVWGAEPARGASCSNFAAGANACTTEGCLVCTAGVWIGQPVYFGASTATCNSGSVGLTRYNASGNGIIVRQITPTVSTAGNYSTTLSILPVAGNTIIVPIGVWNDTVTSVTDSAGNSYTQAVTSLQNVTRTYIFYASNIVTNNMPITITIATTGEANFGAVEVEGLATSSSLDQTGSTSSDGGHTTTVSTSGSTSQAAEFAIAVHDAAYNNNLGYTYAAGWQQLFVQNDSSCCNGTHSVYKILSGTSTISHSWNFADPVDGFRDVSAAIATFKGANGPGVLQFCDGTNWISIPRQ